MPDISMCKNDACPMAGKCYRHEAKPDPNWQSYGDFAPDADGKCEYYWPLLVTAARKEAGKSNPRGSRPGTGSTAWYPCARPTPRRFARSVLWALDILYRFGS